MGPSTSWMGGTWQAKAGVGPMKGGGCHNKKAPFLLWHPPPFMGPTPAFACQVPPIHEVLGPTHFDIPLLTGFLSPPQGFEPVTKSLRSLGKHPCNQLSLVSDVHTSSAFQFLTFRLYLHDSVNLDLISFSDFISTTI